MKPDARTEPRSDGPDLDVLFGGTINFVGLSNQRALVGMCPKEFFDHHNPWVKAASGLFFCGGSMKAWKWKQVDHKKQLGCFKAVLSSWELPHESKEALAGWMLSEMLTEVPVVEIKLPTDPMRIRETLTNERKHGNKP